MFKYLIGIFIAILPHRLKLLLLRHFYRYDIHETARIGFSIILVDHLSMGEYSRIGNLNVFKGSSNIELKDYSTIGNLNWITGFPLSDSSEHFIEQTNRKPSLVLGEHAAITNRHMIDCTDLVSVGRYTTLAGFRSQILTHSISISESRQRCKPIYIGEYSFVGTGAIILPGAKLPNYSILGAGSILNKQYIDEYYLYAGNPAKPIKKLKSDDLYFRRNSGYVI